MPPTLGRKLRFSDVAHAIDTTPKSLRLWLQRDLVEIRSPKPEGGAWAEYNFLDVAILALVRALANFGVEVLTASSIANTIMSDHFFPMMQIYKTDNMPAGALAVMWANQRMHVFRNGEEWEMRLVPLWESELPRRALIAKQSPEHAVDPADANLNLDAPSGIAALRAEIEPAPVFISIDVETVLRTAFDRATESASDGAD